jgi:potassium efflux system protein
MKGVSMRLYSYFLLVLLVFPGVSTAAQDTGPLSNPDSRESLKNAATDRAGKEKDPESLMPNFPGLSEVGPKASDLTKKADDTRKLISSSTKISSQSLDIDKAEARLKKLQDLVAKISDSDYWDATQRSDTNVLILKEKKELETMVAKISVTLADLESIRSEWEKQQTYWREWREYLNSNNIKTLMETFDAAQKTTSRILADLAGAINGVFAIQGRASRLLYEYIKFGETVEAAFSEQQKNIFKKNKSSFFSADFYSQFNASFWSSARSNIGNFENPFDRRYVWRIATRIFIFLASTFLILFLRGSARPREYRMFLLYHPWTFGIFLAETLAVIFFDYPTGLARDLSSSLWAFSALILVSGLLHIRPGRLVISFLAALVAVPGILKIIPLPDPLFRIYWAGTMLAGTLLFAIWARQMRRSVFPSKELFSGCLRVVAFVMALVAAGQIAGFASLSENLLFFTMNIAFLVIGVILLLQINSILIVLLLEHPLIAGKTFIRRFGNELGERLKTIMKVAVWGMAFLFLLPIAGVFSSVGKAFEKLFLSQVAVGSLSLSLSLVLLAAIVMYLSSFISWIIRAVLESEIFPRMRVDAGASQSITKLLHYFLILIGFLISMSVIGMDWKSFAVLGGALGIGIGFGLQNIVNNFISGLILLFERPIRVGDRIGAGSQIGIVKKIGLRSTVIETSDPAQLIVPNSKLISENVTNWTHSGTVVRLIIPVAVAYGSDVDLVFDALTAAALASPRVLTDPKPIALLQGFGDFSLKVELQAWLFDVNESRFAQSEISREIIRRFVESGIEIPFPQQDVRLRYTGNTR